MMNFFLNFALKVNLRRYTEVTGARRLAGVGHSMGGMLVACLAAGAADLDSPTGEQDGVIARAQVGDQSQKGKEGETEWEMTRVVTLVGSSH